MLTVSDDDADLFAALRAGADGYLLKTMDLRQAAGCAGRRLLRRGGHAADAGRARAGPLPRAGAAMAARCQRRAGRRRLTSREWEVLELLAQRRSTAEIADELVLSASAVRVHIASIVRKLEVADRAAAAELFRRPGT